MRSGLLKYVITFTKPISVDTDFSKNDEYVDYITTRANVYHNRGNKIIEAREVFTSFTVTFEIRMFHKIESNMRIRHNGKTYSILDINPEPDKQRISIIAEILNE